nr:cell wall-binding repeat-containing protein [Desulfitobacterium hafniense]
FSDSLAAAPLSKKLDAPILMTGSSTLDDRTLAGLRELGARNIYIVGGTVAIAQEIEDSLSKDYTVTRIAGLQGYDTAALISAQVGIDSTQTVYLANGSAIPDAIAISAFAGAQGNPILLTDKDVLPPSTLQALTNLNATNVVLLGGTAVISNAVENELSSRFLVKRWGGYDRYDTQSIIFQNLLNKEAPQSPLYFTSGLVRQDDVSWGKPYADALLTAALAAKNGGIVAMTEPNAIPSGLNFFLLFNKGYIPKSVVVGNNSGVSYNVEQQLQQMLNH